MSLYNHWKQNHPQAPGDLPGEHTTWQNCKLVDQSSWDACVWRESKPAGVNESFPIPLFGMDGCGDVSD